MEEFVKTLTEQIRYKKARENVANEITAHILDQAQSYEAAGMAHEEAMERAVLEMGDPVEAGMALDRIHRPQTDWKMILMTLSFSILGFFIMCQVNGLSDQYDLAKQILFMLIGFGVTTGVYFLDPGFIGRYAPILYAVLTILFAAFYMTAPHIVGRVPGLSMLIYLYAPVYAGILYRSRKKGYAAFFMDILLLLATAFIAFLLSRRIPAALNLYLVCTAMLVIAVCRNWFCIDKKTSVLCMIIFLFMIPALFAVASAFFGSSYRAMRMRAFLHPFSDPNGASYLYMVIREHLASAEFIGAGPLSDPDIAVPLRESGTTFIPLLLIQSYGWIAGCILVLALTLFLVRALRIACRQRDQLGLMVSASCFLVLLINCCESLFINTGLYPTTDISLPFLSYGGSTTLTYAVLIGLLLSVHRYKMIASSSAKKMSGLLPFLKTKRHIKESDIVPMRTSGWHCAPIGWRDKDHE